MNEKTPTLTVKEAEREYKSKDYNICSWIRKGHVKAEKTEEGYIIERASLEAYLEKKRGAKVPVGDTTIPEAPTPPAASTPAPAPAAEEAPRSQPEQSKEVPPAPPKKDPPPFDLHARPTGRPDSSTPPRSSAAKGPSEHQKARERKSERKEAQREAGKKYRKGPVRYAKDAMRHLDMAQMVDVRDWLLRRMDAKMQLA